MKKIFIIIIAIFSAQFFCIAQSALELVWTQQYPELSIHNQIFSPDGKYLYYSSDYHLYIVSAANGDILREFSRIDSDYVGQSLDVSTNGKYITTGFMSNINLWDAVNESEIAISIKPNKDYSDKYRCPYFYPDNENILFTYSKWISGKTRTELQKYNIKQDSVIARSEILKNVNGSIYGIGISHNGKTFITDASYSPLYSNNPKDARCSITLWDAETFEPIKELSKSPIFEYDLYLKKFKYSANDSLIMVLNTDENAVSIIDAKSFDTLFTSDKTKDYRSMDMLPDNKHFLLLYVNNGEYFLEVRDFNSLLYSYPVNGRSIETYFDNQKNCYVLCGSSMYKTVYTGISELADNLELTCNYLFGNLTIHSAKTLENASVRVFDVFGKQMSENSFSELTNGTQIKIPLAIGAYICQIAANGSTQTVKFIVEN